MNKKNFQIFITIFFLISLFLFPNASFEGAKKGLLLWFQIVLPTLLPFLIFSNLIFHLNITQAFSVFLYPILNKIMPITKHGCYPIAIGLLSGYPMGAKACADMTTSKKISVSEGQFLLAFCNNASPMFLLNYVLLQSLHIETNIPIFMSILITSSLLCGYIYLFFHKEDFNYLKSKNKTSYSNLKHNYSNTNTPSNIKKKEKKEAPSAFISNETSLHTPTYFQILDISIMNSFEIITKIGGYIILFSLLANLIVTLLPISDIPKAILIGILEITTGIQYIENSSLSYPVKILLAMTLSSFGGLSSIAQTGSVLLLSPLKLSIYVKYKFLNSIICLLLTLFYLYISS